MIAPLGKTAQGSLVPEERGAAAARSSWASLRILLPVSIFAALVVLEVLRGLGRLEAQRVRHQDELTQVLERQLEQLAREVEEKAGEGGRHAAHLARSAAVRELLAEPTPERQAALERLLLPYLVSFQGIDRISVLDPGGRELVRCERMGQGVAALPAHLLAGEPQTFLLRLVAEAAPGEIVVSELVDDVQRVEVAEADRRVFHYATRSPEASRAEARGIVVVTVYAAPLLHALAAFRPLPGVTSALLDAQGRVLLGAPEPGAGPGVAEVLAADARAGELLRAGSERVPARGAALLARPVRGGPAARVVCAVPDAAFQDAVGPARGELLAVVLPTVAIAGLIALGSAFFVRASLRARRLRETEHYLARIADESRRHRALMEAAADLILVVDPDARRVRDWNRRAGELFGLGERPPPQGLALEALGAAFDAQGRALLERTLDAALAQGGTARAEGLRGRGAAGERLDFDLRCVALDYAGEPLVELLLSDRTRELEMERQVRVAERLSSLGLLTAGVAHEINNPLEGIGNYLTLLEKSGASEERRTRYLAEIRRGFQRIRDIVGDLLRFGRPESGAADLSRAVREALSVARYTSDLRHVEVTLAGLDEPLWVNGSEGRLQQVFLNLLLNAGRAMGGRGRIAVASARREPDWVEVRVSDEGPGIPEEDLERIFDPFFTKSGGTGLGLAVSYGIVRAHGGVLSARNRAQGGAELELRLPYGPPPANGGNE